MLPLIIKGFLPQQNGSSIMLPADITQIAGSDFDVDKMFLMIPEFNFYTHDKRSALRDFREITRDSKTKEFIDSMFKLFGNKSEQDLDTSELEDKDEGWKEWWAENKYKYEYEQPTIRKVRYNNDRGPEGNSRRQRNNMIIDIAFGILTHKDTAEKINNPGNFDKAKLAARRANIVNDAELLDAYININGINSIDELTLSLLNADLDTLDKFIGKYRKERNPLSVDTFIYNHRQNMTGGALIGMYANNTTMQAKYQLTRLALKGKYAFTINGRVIESLHESYTKIGNIDERVSKNCANFSAASVDNVKDPVLADLLQNTKTANVAGFMLRAGMSIEEVGLLFTQPLVRKCIDISGGVSQGDLQNIISIYLKRFDDLGGGTIRVEDILSKDFTSRELLSNTLLFNEAEKSGFSKRVGDRHPAEILAANIESALLFKHIADIADKLAELTRISRADSPNGAIARSIAMMKNQIHRVDRFIKASKIGGDFPFVGIEDVMRNGYATPDMSISDLRKAFNSASMPMLQAFYTLGIEFGQKLSSRYFAQLNPIVEEMVDTLYYNSPWDTIPDDILEKFYAELVEFALSKTSIFGDDEANTFDQKRDYYLYDFPKAFVDIITDPASSDIANLSIIRKLRVDNGMIVMDNSGKVTPVMREMLMRDMDTLLYMNETSRKLALDLFMYSYYKDGFNFGPRNYGSFFSTVFLNSIPEVVDCLRNMNFTMESESHWNRFLEQFYANHYSDDILPSFKTDDDPFSQITKAGNGQLLMPRRKVTNRHEYGNKVHRLIVCDDVLYQVDPNLIGENSVVYNPVKTHKDPMGIKYNANMTAAEMADVEVDEARVKAAIELNTQSSYEAMLEEEQDTDESSMYSDDLEMMDADDLDGFDDSDFDFLSGLSAMNEKPCNI